MPMEKKHFYLVLLLLLSSYAAAQERDPNSPPDRYGFNQNFNPSMAIIIIVLISAFFFMGFFSIYIRQCAGERSDRSVRPGTGAAGRSRRAAKGLDPTVIESFPTFVYSVVKGLKIGKGTLECAVCLNEFEDDETLRLLPKCDHVFHPECIDAWLSSHVTCPVCRANLIPEAGDTSGQSADAMESAASHSAGSDNDEVAIIVNNDDDDGDDGHDDDSVQQPEVIDPSQLPYHNRPGRSRSARFRFSGKFPRSHSTGHSVVQPGENCERFTLRLPDDIRKKIVAGKLNRTRSLISFPAGYDAAGSSRKGYRGSMNEGSSRGRYSKFWRLDSNAKSDRWVFSMAPPFLTRTGSTTARSPKEDGEGSSRGKKFMTSVKSFKKSIDCMSVRADGDEQGSSLSSSSRPPV